MSLTQCLSKMEISTGSWWKRLKEKREKGETDPEGRRKQCDKTWLSLAGGNYLHANATPGNPSGSMEKDEDEGLRKHSKEKENRFEFAIISGVW